MSTRQQTYSRPELIRRLRDMDKQIIDGSDIFLQCAEAIEHLHTALLRVWTDDEMGYLISANPQSCECVKCGQSAATSREIKHGDGCVQGYVAEALYIAGARADDETPGIVNADTVNAAARAAHAHIPKTHGFILVLAPFGECGTVNYASNITRADAIKALKTMLFRWGINEEWMTKAQ